MCAAAFFYPRFKHYSFDCFIFLLFHTGKPVSGFGKARLPKIFLGSVQTFYFMHTLGYAMVQI